MNEQEKAEELIKWGGGGGRVSVRSQCEITGASPHAERMRYVEEYLSSTFLGFPLCMKNKGVINDETAVCYFSARQLREDCGRAENCWAKGKLP